MKSIEPIASNPGPSWGFRFLATAEKYLPDLLFSSFLNIGIFVAVCVMSKRRYYSKIYWEKITNKPQRISDRFRHFKAFTEGLVLKLRTGRGILPKFTCSNNEKSKPFLELCRSGEPALFGTFHVGYSDMLGCMLSEFNRNVRMLRLKVANSHDTDLLESIFGHAVNFVWVNQSEEFIFQLNECFQRKESIALQCDRLEGASKTDSFHFLGELRIFPMTIYHLSYLFKIPATITFTGPKKGSGEIEVFPSTIFIPSQNREETLKLAKIHFQEVITDLEIHLKKNPELWFNFEPLNPISNQSRKPSN